MNLKRSSLFHLHRRAGASFTEHCSWELPAFFSSAEQEAAEVRKTVGLADLSHASKFDLQREPPHDGWWLGANHYWMIVEPPLDPPSGSIDISSVYTSLCLAGPRSRDVLSKVTSLDVSDVALPNLRAAQGLVAHTHAVVLREDIGSIPAFHLLVSREYGESVWETIVDAGHEFQLCPFGLTALKSLLG
jgi:glycine cleavage system aminomethyltransferase T